MSSPTQLDSRVRVRRDAYAAIQRDCAAPLDTIALRERLLQHLRPALRLDCGAASRNDPEFGIMTHSVAWNMPSEAVTAYREDVYPNEAAGRFIDLARQGVTATRRVGALEASTFKSFGVRSKILLTFPGHGRLYGVGCLFRAADSPEFTDDDEAFAQSVAALVAPAMRRAHLRELAAEPEQHDERLLPGMAVHGADGRTLVRDARAAAYMDDLREPWCADDPEVAPSVVACAIAHLRWSLAHGEPAPALRGVRGRGRSGRWYVVHVSAGEATSAADAGRWMVVIAPLDDHQRADALIDVYGLSPREREILARTARGESGKAIAAAMGISPHTVQAHVNNACAKVGVRGRKELLAKLYFERLRSA